MECQTCQTQLSCPRCGLPIKDAGTIRCPRCFCLVITMDCSHCKQQKKKP